MAETEFPRLSRRAEWTAYAAAFTSVALLPMANLVVPLLALGIGAGPVEIGIIMGARSLAPFLLAIHAGSLIDRLGVRRVLGVCALLNIALTLLYPVLPWVAALIGLQIVLGLTTTMGWIGAQTQIGQLTRGDPLYMGRFTFTSNIANFFGPLAVGIAWDLGGAWGAFGLVAVWGLGMWVSVAALPVPAAAARPSAGRPRLGELLPRFSDFRAAFRLALVPTIAFVVACSFLLNAALSMRFSFYVVYLESVGLTGTVIGALYGTAFLAAAFAALAIRPLTRAIRPQWLLILAILVAVAGIAATPLLDGFLALFLLACFFGFGHGLTMALVHSVLTRVVAVDRLGVCIGLRITINRFSSLTIPVIMGLVVKGWDLAVGFYAMGALIGLTTLVLGIVLLRFPATGRLDGEN